MKSKFNSIRLLSILISVSVSLVACNTTTGDNLNMDTPGIYAMSTANNQHKLGEANLKGISKPLVITTQLQSNALASLITVTNPNSSAEMITSDPVLTNNAFTLDTRTSSYPSGAVICAKDMQIQANSSCMMLINTSNTSTTNQTGVLRLITPTYTYVLGLAKAQIIYAAGNFSQASLDDSNFAESKIQSSNVGTCGADGKASCMVVAYNTLTKTLKEIAETKNEIYALAVNADNSLLVGGAFSEIITTAMENSIAIPDDIKNSRLSSTLIAQIEPATNIATAYANANQSVYALSVSPLIDSGTNLGNVYIAGAFSAIYTGLTNTALINPQIINGVEQCLSVSKSPINDWSIASTGNGVTTSLATAKSKSSQSDNLLIAGLANTQKNITLPNYNVGVTSCVGANCNTVTPLALNATPNVIVGTPDNRMLISGEFTNINGVGSYTHNDVLASGTLQTIGQFSKISSGDSAVHALLATNDDYFMGGNFSQMNKAPVAKGTMFGARCGVNHNNLCVLADYNTLNFNTVNLLYTDDDINAITSGIELQVTIPR